MSKTAGSGILLLSLIYKNMSEHNFLYFIWGMMMRVLNYKTSNFDVIYHNTV